MAMAQHQPRDLSQGDVVWTVKNRDLASALLAVGINLVRNTVAGERVRPFMHRKMANGTTELCYFFEAQDDDGVLVTGALIKAFSEDMKFIEANPKHPFTIAMCAVKNANSFADHARNDTPYVGFKSPRGKSILWVKEGSKKEARCRQKGMIQV
jgi:hypothetical protein